MQRKLIISDFDDVITSICPKWIEKYITECHPNEIPNIESHKQGVKNRSGYYMTSYTGLPIDYEQLLSVYSNDPVFYDDLPYEPIVDGLRTGLANRNFDLAIVSLVVNDTDPVNASKERMFNALFGRMNGVSLHLVHGMSKREYVEKNGLSHYSLFIDDKFATIVDLMTHHKGKEFKVPLMEHNRIKSEEEEAAIKDILDINKNQLFFYKSN